jgi:hypothetical protein
MLDEVSQIAALTLNPITLAVAYLAIQKITSFNSIIVVSLTHVLVSRFLGHGTYMDILPDNLYMTYMAFFAVAAGQVFVMKKIFAVDVQVENIKPLAKEVTTKISKVLLESPLETSQKDIPIKLEPIVKRAKMLASAALTSALRIAVLRNQINEDESARFSLENLGYNVIPNSLVTNLAITSDDDEAVNAFATYWVAALSIELFHKTDNEAVRFIYREILSSMEYKINEGLYQKLPIPIQQSWSDMEDKLLSIKREKL